MRGVLRTDHFNAELQEAVNRGLLSEFGAATLKTWDINFSKLVSWKEFQFGPLFIMQLKVNAPLLAKFKRSPVTNSFAVSTVRCFARLVIRVQTCNCMAVLSHDVPYV